MEERREEGTGKVSEIAEMVGNWRLKSRSLMAGTNKLCKEGDHTFLQA